MTTVRKLRSKYQAGGFAALRGVHQALDVPDMQDTILFTPLLVTDLARFLNKGHDESMGKKSPVVGDYPDDFTVRNTQLLVVDDNEINLMVSGEMLRTFAAEVSCADNGPEALKLCARQKFDIIFLDHMMPEMDGIEVTNHIRNTPGLNQQTPIIALTANVVNNMQSYYVRCGMDDFIGKPVEFSDLGRILCRWLPSEKIVGEMAVTTSTVRKAAPKYQGANVEQQVAALDRYGMAATAAVAAAGGDTDGYFSRLDTANQTLGVLTARIGRQARDGQWPVVEQDLEVMAKTLAEIGAPQDAQQADALRQAIIENDVEKAENDLPELIGRVYMLEKKLDTAVQRAQGMGTLLAEESEHLYRRLEELLRQLEGRDMGKSMMLLEDLAAHSIDRDLDKAIYAVHMDLEQEDFAAAMRHYMDVQEAAMMMR
jgi:CheY-like chemotaxis protein